MSAGLVVAIDHEAPSLILQDIMLPERESFALSLPFSGAEQMNMGETVLSTHELYAVLMADENHHVRIVENVLADLPAPPTPRTNAAPGPAPGQ